jgi:hypothetical protein
MARNDNITAPPPLRAEVRECSVQRLAVGFKPHRLPSASGNLGDVSLKVSRDEIITVQDDAGVGTSTIGNSSYIAGPCNKGIASPRDRFQIYV